MSARAEGPLVEFSVPKLAATKISYPEMNHGSLTPLPNSYASLALY